MATNPTSESELQLYRVLQRANLLQYFDTFISQGGDDVQQLCEAGEEEFLEIMALVGMASKPLHVRRLQKALQEWISHPALFHQPLGALTLSPPIATGSILASVQRPYLKMVTSSISGPTSTLMHNTPLTSATSLSNWPGLDAVIDTVNVTRSSTPSSVNESIYSDSIMHVNGSLGSNGGNTAAANMDSPPSGSNSCIVDDSRCLSPGGTNPALTEGQLAAIEHAAEELAKTLPPYQAKPLNMKKLINKEIEVVMRLPFNHSERIDLLRKYGAIYGRFDSNRKNEKTLSLHEVSVNEAAAQLCRYRVELLTRRNDLFPLARQVVRDSGYQYSKGHSRGQSVDLIASHKRPRLEGELESTSRVKSENRTSENNDNRMNLINRELTEITAQMRNLKDRVKNGKSNGSGPSLEIIQNQIDNLTVQQRKLLTEQTDLLHKQRTNKRLSKDKINSDPHKDDDSEFDDDSIPFPSEGPDLFTNQDDLTDNKTMLEATIPETKVKMEVERVHAEAHIKDGHKEISSTIANNENDDGKSEEVKDKS